MRRYIRTCQECGHRQEMRPPAEQRSDAWRNAKCRKCNSEALDYGTWQEVDANLNPLPTDDSEWADTT